MGLRINTNVASLGAQNRLAQTTKKLGGTLQRLSTGLRINNASDDVVGLFKSESLRSNIRGIAVAEQNISSASNLLGIAEGALSQLTELTQSIREKVVQAADSTISSNDRTNITTSINDLLSEYSRLVAASEFNGVKLLDGTFSNKNFQVGSGVADQIGVSIADARSAQIGSGAILTVISRSYAATATDSFTDIGGLNIGGTSISSTAFVTDGVSYSENSNSAIAIANAINTNAGGSGVTATALANVVTLTYTSSGSVNWSAANSSLSLNGVALSLTGTLAATDANAQTYVDAINNVSGQTGVTASLSSGDDRIVLTASDGRNINFSYTNSSGNSTDCAGITNLLGVSLSSASAVSVNYIGYRSSVRLFADSAFSITDSTASAILSGVGTTATSIAVTTSNLTLNTLNVTNVTNSQTGLFILDNVIRQIQSRRTNVGSKVNRFETALKEIQARKENLSTAESVIRDADIAKETADLTATQVLQQAGVQVLSRANSLPQIALELLRAGQ